MLFHVKKAVLFFNSMSLFMGLWPKTLLFHFVFRWIKMSGKMMLFFIHCESLERNEREWKKLLLYFIIRYAPMMSMTSENIESKWGWERVCGWIKEYFFLSKRISMFIDPIFCLWVFRWSCENWGWVYRSKFGWKVELFCY